MPNWETDNYPSWERVVPADWQNNELNYVISFKVTDALVDFLKKIVSLSKNYPGNRIQIDTDVKSQTITCTLPTVLDDVPTVSFKLECTVEADFKFAVNMSYLFDAIRGVITRTSNSVVELRFNREHFNYNTEYIRPIVICEPLVETDPSYRYAVVMPMTYSV